MKMYRQIILAFLFCSFLFHFAKAQLSGTSLTEATRTNKATLTCPYSESPGYIMSISKSAPQGLLPDIMAAFATYMKDKYGMDIQYTYQSVKPNTPLAQTLQNITTAGDGVFGLIFIFMTEERRKTLTFSSPIFNSPSFLLTSNSTPVITSVEEAATILKGHTAYTNQGNLYDSKFKELKKSVPGLGIEYWQSYGTTNISPTLLKDKTLLYVDITGMLYATKNRLLFKNQKFFQFTMPMGIIFPQSTTWKKPFDEFLASGFLKSSQFKKIVANNLGYPTLQFLQL